MISRTAVVNFLFYAAIAAAAVCGTVFVLIPELRIKEDLRRQRDALVVSNAVFSAEIAQTKMQRNELETNPESLIRWAHDHGYAAPNETVFFLPEKSEESPPAMETAP